MVSRWYSWLLVFLCCFTAFPLQAEIYKWTDEKGRVHFGDKPVAQHTAEPVELSKMNTMTAVDIPENLFDRSATTPSQSIKTTLPRLSKGRVVMYSTQNCGYCGLAKDYMKRNGIAYQEKDINRSASAKQEFVRYGGRGVPLLLIGTASGTKKLAGFNEASFKAVYSN